MTQALMITPDAPKKKKALGGRGVTSYRSFPAVQWQLLTLSDWVLQSMKS